MMHLLRNANGIYKGFHVHLIVLEKGRYSEKHTAFDKISPVVFATSGTAKVTTVTDILDNRRWIYYVEVQPLASETVHFFGESITEDGYECIAIAYSKYSRAETRAFAEDVFPEQTELFNRMKRTIEYGKRADVSDEEYLRFKQEAFDLI